MQKPIIQPMETVLMPIPLDLLQEAGIDPQETLQMSVSRNRLIIEQTDAPCNMVCFGNCARCPGTKVCRDYCG